MGWTYDPTNIFARILRGEIPNRTVMDTPHTLVFHDINPQAPVHVLAIPKGAYVTLDHFAAEASAEEMLDFHRTVAKVCAILGLSGPEGFRAISNAGAHGMQEVPHYHLHSLGGRVLGRLLEPV
ncbi:MAG: HIT domain-containing protein [Rhodobacterales bacterium]|nr:HIT domain-containing protein [Rhodobacterales bacterium]